MRLWRRDEMRIKLTYTQRSYTDVATLDSLFRHITSHLFRAMISRYIDLRMYNLQFVGTCVPFACCLHSVDSNHGTVRSATFA